MVSKIEYRQANRMGAEIRAAEVGGIPGVVLHAITPDVVDDYGSLWMADAFDESLSVRMPTLCWGHDWSEPLGSGVDHTTGPTGPDVRFVFDDFDAVPRARQAYAQIQPKADGSPPTIQDCSVGFSDTQRRSPTPDEERRHPGIREVITKASLDEISLVLRGAVPGAKVLAVRSAGQRSLVDVDAVVELAKKMAAGDITEDEAKVALALLADDEPPASAGGAGGAGDDGQQEGDEQTPEEIAAALEVDDALSAADEAMLLLERSR